MPEGTRPSEPGGDPAVPEMGSPEGRATLMRAAVGRGSTGRVTAARAPWAITRAQAAAEGWRATADDLVLLSPVDGVVSSRNVEPGEVLAAGQSAITVGQPMRPWARIYVSTGVLSRLRSGDTLVARLDGDTTSYRGRITAIATKAEFTPRVALTEQERADLLFGVKVEFADTMLRLRAGVPITVQLPRATH